MLYYSTTPFEYSSKTLYNLIGDFYDNYNKVLETLGKNVRYYRNQMNLTQETLAEKCDLSARYISDIENERKCFVCFFRNTSKIS